MTAKKSGAQGVRSAVAAGAFLAGGASLLIARLRRYDDLRDRLDRMEDVALRLSDRVELAHQQRVHLDLLDRALADQDLAAVLDIYEGTVTPRVQRQYVFANLLYVNALRAHQMGIVDRGELFGHLRGIFQNPICRDYWKANARHRETLAVSSVEARVGRMVDRLIRDLDDAESDEWWVVGEPPEE
ncbi:DUF6082 family protein [Streptomyces tsukubensis]|uniref:Secreted protein n=1 Tax=Streptomyces tsukubensis TaxID=83656 RepID=A0A1V4A4Y2_9ACTN|nr:DUF6082 family protein [Streptomyces tsukubensis]OON75123.1 hypothetical protein B1H18_23455 [Streptomyces tsukubensis]QFR96128.1 hypothetical protein GBW32_27665 [Streptomyces tsukubensis]